MAKWYECIRPAWKRQWAILVRESYRNHLGRWYNLRGRQDVSKHKVEYYDKLRERGKPVTVWEAMVSYGIKYRVNPLQVIKQSFLNWTSSGRPEAPTPKQIFSPANIPDTLDEEMYNYYTTLLSSDIAALTKAEAKFQCEFNVVDHDELPFDFLVSQVSSPVFKAFFSEEFDRDNRMLVTIDFLTHARAHRETIDKFLIARLTKLHKMGGGRIGD